ncbi:hypothetical protein BGZ79_003022 [Entomortierella chlamydospora]|nr:hypothetical protein BGZ79_003022 [Entomortierella chlamydospora]
MTSPLQAYRIRHSLSGNRRNSNESCNDSSSICYNNNNNIVSKNDNGSGSTSNNSHNGHSAQNVSQDHISRDHADFGCRPTSGPVSNAGFGSDSVSMSSSTSWAPSTEASSLASLPPSPSPLVTPTSEVDPKHDELMMLKHEAFQELASQTQRFDDLFIAKMIYWESLDAEEKAQWLEREQTGNTDRGTEEVEMDELISALDCRVTCKDYSALIAFERQVETERRQHQMTEHQQRRTC